MKKYVRSIGVFLVMLFWVSCGSSSSTTTSDTTTVSATDYAVFGSAVNDAVPDGLKTTNPSANISAMTKELLAGDCSTSYISCPTFTQAGGGDSNTGEILSRLWALDYETECTAAYLADGTCIDCPECSTGGYGTSYIKPTILSSPSSCSSTSTTAARYVNFGVDPCFFDTMIAEISNMTECQTTEGDSVDISSAIPWYASWGIPQVIEFSGFHATDSDGVAGGMWWAIDQGNLGTSQYFLSIDANWLYAGIKDTDNDKFIFLGTGSPAYYSGNGDGNGINIAGYAGTLSAIPAEFEAIQIRDQGEQQYIERMRSNGSYLWYQTWSGTDFPSTSTDIDIVKSTPTDTRCVSIGASIELTKYVPASQCVTSFDVADEDALNNDDLFTLKLVDAETAGSIDFSTGVTTDTTDACMSATRSWQGCVSGTTTVTEEASSAGNLMLSAAGTTMVQYYGGSHVYLADGTNASSWTTWSGAQSGRNISSSQALFYDGSAYMVSGATSPIPGFYIQKNTDNSSWADFSTAPSGFYTSNTQLKKDSTYFYASYSIATDSTGPVRVYRLPLDGSTDDWEYIGADIANTTSHDYIMDANSSNIFVTDTSSGLSVTKYTNSTGEWATIGDALTSDSVESHDMLPIGEDTVFIAWTLPSSYELNVAKYTAATGWQTIGSFTDIRASDVWIDYVGSTIYVLYKNVGSNNDLTMKSYTEGTSTEWEDYGSVIETNGPTIYDFNVIGQTPYVLYSHTDSGSTPLTCQKYATE